MFGIGQLIDFLGKEFGVVIELNAVGEETYILSKATIWNKRWSIIVYDHGKY